MAPDMGGHAGSRKARRFLFSRSSNLHGSLALFTSEQKIDHYKEPGKTMSPLKKSVFITAAIFFMSFIACGGGNNNGADTRVNPPSVVNISITPTANALVGETKTIPVTTQNTDFTVSVSPASGSECNKSGANVVCTPTTAGTYNITVTATADNTKRAVCILTVTEDNDDPGDPDDPIKASYTLIVKKFGEGAITGGGINCGDSCEETYEEGTTVTLTATAAADWEFRSWIGCDSVSGASCTATVDADKTLLPVFGRRALQVSTDVVVLDDAAMSSFMGNTGTKYNFDLSAEQIGDLNPGDIIVGSEGEGFLRRVVSVKTEDGRYVVETSDAALADAITEGTVSWTRDLTVDDIESVPLAAGLSVGKPARFPTGAAAKDVSATDVNVNPEIIIPINLNTILYEGEMEYGDETISGKIELSGNSELRVRANLAMDFKWGLQELMTVFESEYDYNLEVIVSGGYSGQIFEKEFPPIKFGAILVPVGGIPVLITPELVIKAVVEIGINGEITSTLYMNVSGKAGMHYKKGEFWKPIVDFKAKKGLDVKAGVKAELIGKFAPELKLKLYGMVGPFVEVEVFGEVSAQLNQLIKGRLLVEAKAGLNAYGGAEVKIFSFATKELAKIKLFPGEEWPLGKWDIEISGTETPIEPPVTPQTPSGLAAVPASSDTIYIVWNKLPVINAKSYNIYRNGTFLTSVPDTPPDFLDRVQPDTRYCYQVSATNEAGQESAKSAEACARAVPVFDMEAPTVPQIRTAEASAPGEIVLFWEESTDNDRVAGYVIYRDGWAYTVSVPRWWVYDVELDASTQYCYQISAFDPAGNESGKSEQICATTYGDDPFEGQMVFVARGTFTMGCTPELRSGGEDWCDNDPYGLGSDPNFGLPYLSICYYHYEDYDLVRTTSCSPMYGGIECRSYSDYIYDEFCYDDEVPAHEVTLSQDFYIGKYEVTQEQWKAVMGADNNPSYFKGDNLPVENVSWDDIHEFIYRLHQMTDEHYRLPTEAEWEYAARGGNQNQGYRYSGSNDVGEVAWYSDNSEDSTHPVGSKIPNELGIFDMSGNVSERVSHWLGEYDDSPQTYQNHYEWWDFGDGGTRGGNFVDQLSRRYQERDGYVWGARVWCRGDRPDYHPSEYVGFRLARSPR